MPGASTWRAPAAASSSRCRTRARRSRPATRGASWSSAPRSCPRSPTTRTATAASCSATGPARCWSSAIEPERIGIIDAINRVDGVGIRFLHQKAGGSVHARLGRDRRRQAAHGLPGGPRSLQVRGQGHGRRHGRDGRAQRPDRRRHRPVRAAPGEHPHHRGRPAAAGAARQQGDDHDRPVRQHHLGQHPVGAARGLSTRAACARGTPWCCALSAPASRGVPACCAGRPARRRP